MDELRDAARADEPVVSLCVRRRRREPTED